MELKLFESLLDDLTAVNEAGVNDRLQNRDSGPEAGDFDAEPRQHDDIESHADAIKVYGDNSLVITYEAHQKVYHGQEDSTVSGVASMNIKAFISNGKVIFSAEAHTLPAVELYKWDGDPADLQGLIDGAESALEDVEDKAAIAAYKSLLATHPKLWDDVAAALVQQFQQLDK